MQLAGWLACGIILICWIAFQELSWRSRFEAARREWEERCRAEVDRAFAHGMDRGGRTVASHTFRRKAEVSWPFRRKTGELYLTVTFFDGEVKYISGDIAHLDEFEIPEEIKKLILSSSLILKPGL
jgi:hypothetical protein